MVTKIEQKDPAVSTNERVKELIRQASLSRIQAYSGDFQFESTPLHSGLNLGGVLANRMAIILISGDILRIIFKVHFNLRDAKQLAHRVYGTLTADSIFEHQATDYMKEYCNLTGGYLVKLFEECDPNLGLSLPLYTRGFHEIFSDYTEKKSSLIRFGDCWNLKKKDTQFSCSFLIETFNEDILNRVSSENIDTCGQVEFL